MRNRKIIKRGENSFAIALLKADMDDYGLLEGDMVDIEHLCMMSQQPITDKKPKTKTIGKKEVKGEESSPMAFSNKRK